MRGRLSFWERGLNYSSNASPHTTEDWTEECAPIEPTHVTNHMIAKATTNNVHGPHPSLLLVATAPLRGRMTTLPAARADSRTPHSKCSHPSSGHRSRSCCRGQRTLLPQDHHLTSTTMKHTTMASSPAWRADWRFQSWAGRPPPRPPCGPAQWPTTWATARHLGGVFAGTMQHCMRQPAVDLT